MSRIALYFAPEWRQFTGREFDPERALQSHYTRHYDPTPGQWLSEEPVGNESGDANLYSYVAASAPPPPDPGASISKRDTIVPDHAAAGCSVSASSLTDRPRLRSTLMPRPARSIRHSKR
jgi:RHS repeat-associated protein